MALPGKAERLTPVKRRILSLILTLVLISGLLPVTAKAQLPQQSQQETIQAQAAQNYQKALKQVGWRSFKGFCGACVSNQLQAMGIIRGLKGCDGKDQFNRYQRKKYTDNGYPVRSYSAAAYTLEGAINAVTANGTRNVYNLLVGFESTMSEAGRKFGHALFVHAIIDGMVYFAECKDMIIGGKYYPEGAGICCSIRDFVNYYNDGSTFDGINWFGNNTCAEQCVNYPAKLAGMVTQDAPAYSDVGTSKVHGAPKVTGIIPAGQMLRVLSIIQAPDGAYWYRIWWDGRECYIRPEVLKHWPVEQEAPSVNLNLPASFKQGKWFRLYGTVATELGAVTWLKVELRDVREDTVVFSGETEPGSPVADLAAGPIWNAMQFWRLPVGEYALTVSGTVGSYRVENGALVQEPVTGQLWCGRFQVTEHKNPLPLVSLDAQGGVSRLQQLAADPSKPLGALPTPVKDGYRFLGWFTEPEGGQKVTEDALISGHTTLYAQWSENQTGHTGWQETDGTWIYYRDGSIVNGWFYSEQLRFWQDADGGLIPGWMETEEGLYYLTGSGAMHTGWLDTEEGSYFLGTDGHCVTGWATIRGKRYRFDDGGMLKEGWFYTPGGLCYLTRPNGVVTGLRQIGDRRCLFDREGNFVMTFPGRDRTYGSIPWIH